MDSPTQITFKFEASLDGRALSLNNIGLSTFNDLNKEVEVFLAGNEKRSILEHALIEVGEGSYRITAKPTAALLMLLAPDLIHIVNDNILRDIDSARARQIDKWQRRARKDSTFSVRIYDDVNSKPIVIDSESNYYLEDIWVRVEKYLIGEIKDWGGVTKANIHFVPDGTKNVIILSTSPKTIGEQKQNYVYHRAQLHISAEENISTHEMRDARLIKLIGPPPTYDAKAVESAIEVGTEAWADVPNGSKWLRDLRGEDE